MSRKILEKKISLKKLSLFRDFENMAVENLKSIYVWTLFFLRSLPVSAEFNQFYHYCKMGQFLRFRPVIENSKKYLDEN